MDVAEAEQLARSWQLALRAERKSPQTLKTYGDGLRFYLAWCADRDLAPFTRSTLNVWTAHLLDNGASAARLALVSSPCAGSAPGSPRRGNCRRIRSSV